MEFLRLLGNLRIQIATILSLLHRREKLRVWTLQPVQFTARRPARRVQPRPNFTSDPFNSRNQFNASVNNFPTRDPFTSLSTNPFPNNANPQVNSNYSFGSSLISNSVPTKHNPSRRVPTSGLSRDSISQSFLSNNSSQRSNTFRKPAKKRRSSRKKRKTKNNFLSNNVFYFILWVLIYSWCKTVYDSFTWLKDDSFLEFIRINQPSTIFLWVITISIGILQWQRLLVMNLFRAFSKE